MRAMKILFVVITLYITKFPHFFSCYRYNLSGYNINVLAFFISGSLLHFSQYECALHHVVITGNPII